MLKYSIFVTNFFDMEPEWITRIYESKWSKMLLPGKVLVLYGPRRVGKTKLIERFVKSFQGRSFLGTGDDMILRKIFMSQDLHKVLSSFQPYDLIFIDEAQRIPEIGLGLKMIIDHFPEKRILITGSSSIELFSRLGEPLTGRQNINLLYPISVMEIYNQYGAIEVERKLSDLLVFGAYPEVLGYNNPESKAAYLASLRDAYLLRDLYELASIRHAPTLLDLLRLLAYQIGNEVSLNELGRQLGLSKQSVEKYLYLLEKAFVIKKIRGFSRNLRSEVTKAARYYFWDVGIRNSIINNYNQLSLRNDTGMLWENFLFIERIKKQEYQKLLCNNYFWRTYQQQEVDMVEECDGNLYGFEFKWNSKKVKPPKAWLETYPEASFEAINRDNYLDFIL